MSSSAKIFWFIKKLFSLWLLCSLGSCYAEITEQQVKQNAEKLDKIVIDAMNKMGVPGATYSVAKNGKIIHTACFGVSTINKPDPITNKTLFPIASLSKNITGLTVGALVEEGKIKFDAKVRKYLPDFFLGNENISSKMTIRDLISFRSGFRPFVAESMLVSGYSKDQIMNSLKFYQEVPGAFEKTYSYQNVILGIVGDVLESATGEKYEDLVQKYVFDKLRMSDASAIPLQYEQSLFGYFQYRLSRFGDDVRRHGLLKAISEFFTSVLKHENKHAVSCHAKYEGTMEILPYANGMFCRFPATSGISLAANEFAKWVALISGKGTYDGVQVVSPAMFKELTTKVTEAVNIKDKDIYFPKDRIERNGFGYGVGAFICNYTDNGKNAHPVIFHTAGMYGTTAFYSADLNEGISIGVACNFGGNSHTMFAQYIAMTFLDMCYNFEKKDWVQFEVDTKAKEQKEKMEYYSEIKERNLGAMAEPNKYVGTYTSDIYGDIKVTLENKELFLDNGIRKTKLTHANRDIFEFPGNQMEYAYQDVRRFAVFSRGDNEENFSSLEVSCFEEGKTKFRRKSD